MAHGHFAPGTYGDDGQGFGARRARSTDDRIGRDVVTGFSRGTLVFIGDGAKYRANYHGGAC